MVLALAPALSHGMDRVDHVEEIALHAGSAAGEVHRIRVEAAAVKYDRDRGIFHVRLATGDERILAAVKISPRGSYLARSREGYSFRIRREEVTLHELEVVEGGELVRDLQVSAPRDQAPELMHGLVAVCELRVVAGADGSAVAETIESYPTSVAVPLEGWVRTRVLRVALDAVTLQGATSGHVYRRLEARPILSSAPPAGVVRVDARRR